ncbi:unnamed protein product [Meloidogyne enterolobii]|uniref:Uncharacterized protein n=1 Tax=Meloidogyne enterolobii TaxID=390850 RepID=A0ACB0YR21_MELEN
MKEKRNVCTNPPSARIPLPPFTPSSLHPSFPKNYNQTAFLLNFLLSLQKSQREKINNLRAVFVFSFC